MNNRMNRDYVRTDKLIDKLEEYKKLMADSDNISPDLKENLNFLIEQLGEAAAFMECEIQENQ